MTHPQKPMRSVVLKPPPGPFRTQTATTGSIGTGQLAAGLYTDPTPCFLQEFTEWVPGPRYPSKFCRLQ
jgi:hypothetical protein